MADDPSSRPGEAPAHGRKRPHSAPPRADDHAAAALPVPVSFLSSVVSADWGELPCAADVGALFAAGALTLGQLSDVGGALQTSCWIKLMPPPAAWPVAGNHACLLCRMDASGQFVVVPHAALIRQPKGSAAARLGHAWNNAKKSRGEPVPIGDRGGWVQHVAKAVQVVFPPAAGGTAVRDGEAGAAVRRDRDEADEGLAEAEAPRQHASPLPRRVQSEPPQPGRAAPSRPLDASRDLVLCGATAVGGVPPPAFSEPALLLSQFQHTRAPVQWAWVEAAFDRPTATDITDFIVSGALQPESMQPAQLSGGAVLVLALLTAMRASPRTPLQSVLAVCGDPPRLHVFAQPRKSDLLRACVKAARRRLGDALAVTLSAEACSVDVKLLAVVHDPESHLQGPRARDVASQLWQQALLGRAAVDASARAAAQQAHAAAAAAREAATAQAQAAAAAAAEAEAADGRDAVAAPDVTADLRVSVTAHDATTGDFIATLPVGKMTLVALTPEAAQLATRFGPKPKHGLARSSPPEGGAEAVAAGTAARNAALDPLAAVPVITTAQAHRRFVPAPPLTPGPVTPPQAAHAASGEAVLPPDSVPFAMPASVCGVTVGMSLQPQKLRALLCDLLQPLSSSSPEFAAAFDDGDEDGAAPASLFRASMSSVLSVARGLATHLVAGPVAYQPARWSSVESVPLHVAVRVFALYARRDWAMSPPPSPPRACVYGASADVDFLLSIHPAATLHDGAVTRNLEGGARIVHIADTSAYGGTSLQLPPTRVGAGVTSVDGAQAVVPPK